MPRYYFNVKRAQMTILDQQGIELPNTAGAEGEAAQRAEQIATREGQKATRAGGRMIIIADDNWEPLLELPF
jgi:hypothetical protein